MTRVLHRPRRDEALLLDATVHAAPAAHLSGSHASRPIRFDDVDLSDLPDPVAKPIAFDDVAPETEPSDEPEFCPLYPGVSAATLGALRHADHQYAPVDLDTLAVDLRAIDLAVAARADRAAGKEMADTILDIAAAHFNAGEPHAILAALAPIAEQLGGAL